jgi:3-deoxy-D-manno-octulosonic-acid transferase
MRFIYNIIVVLAGLVLRLVALFQKKIKSFVDGRKNVFSLLEKELNANDNTIWFHAASLGEFEQGRPVIEKLKKQYPDYKILLTFFSPSGYEVKKDYEHADVVCYLPLDTISNAKKFLKLVNPKLAVFVKYEFWPNYLFELKKNEVPTILISGIFREKQLFFKSYGAGMKRMLHTFSHFFVQDKNSEDLLKSINFSNVTVSGDTRFDRVHDILQQDNHLDFIHEFKDDKSTLVAGSTWSEDEDFLASYVNEKAKSNEKFIIAPHNIKTEGIQRLQKSINVKTVLFSEKEGKNLKDYQVFIIDTIGILTKIYAAADIAYVGGAFRTGLHNILEPATFGVPIVIGPIYQKFNEAKDLVAIGGCITTSSQEEISTIINQLVHNADLRLKKGKIAQDYITASLGASEKIFSYIEALLK